MEQNKKYQTESHTVKHCFVKICFDYMSSMHCVRIVPTDLHYSKRLQTTDLRPNLACLPVSIKFYWNTAMPVHLHIPYGVFSLQKHS